MAHGHLDGGRVALGKNGGDRLSKTQTEKKKTGWSTESTGRHSENCSFWRVFGDVSSNEIQKGKFGKRSEETQLWDEAIQIPDDITQRLKTSPHSNGPGTFTFVKPSQRFVERPS